MRFSSNNAPYPEYGCGLNNNNGVAACIVIVRTEQLSYIQLRFPFFYGYKAVFNCTDGFTF